jgi:hypothetical protein
MFELQLFLTFFAAFWMDFKFVPVHHKSPQPQVNNLLLQYSPFNKKCALGTPCEKKQQSTKNVLTYES